MSMIDPITKLPTPLSMLGGRQVLSPFPVSGFGGGGLLGEAATIAPSVAQAAPVAARPFANMAGQAAASLPRFATGAGGDILAESAALGGGGGGGILSRLPGLGSISRTAGTWGELGTAAKLGRGLGAGILGEVGSRAFDAWTPGSHNSNLEQGLQGAAQGAALGAVVGAPFFGIGAVPAAAIGALGGGALGVLGNVLGLGGDDGEDSKAADPVTILGNGIAAAQLDPDTTEEILQAYEVMTALAEAQPEGDARDQAMAQAFNTSAEMILQAMQQKEQMASQATNTLALQAQAQDIFAPLAQDITDSSMLYANAMKGIRDTLPESYRPIADATVARELSSAQRLASAYQAQAAVTPVVNRLTQYQQDYNNLAAQQFSQALAQQAAGGSASLGGSTSDVLAALTP